MQLGAILAASNGGGIIAIVVYIVIIVLALVGFWKTLEKGGESGAWALLFLTGCLYPVAFLPVCRMTGRPGWWVILLYIPIVNIVVLAILSIDLAKSFGKSTGYGIGLWLLSFIFYPMLGFGESRYEGPVVTQA
jgi:uncharacterized membrane protein